MSKTNYVINGSGIHRVDKRPGTRPEPTDAQILGDDPIPDQELRDKPQVNIKLTVEQLATVIAAAIPKGELYLYNDRYITVTPQPDKGKYKTREICPSTFISWSTKYVDYYTQSGSGANITRSAANLSEQKAKHVLNAPMFRDTIPVINAFCKVRLPQLKLRDGKPHFEPAPIGYDPETGLYTIDSLTIDWDKIYPIDTVRKVFIRTFSEFALDGGLLTASNPDPAAVNPLESPSLGGCVCAMLGQFLHHCIDRFPIIIFNANKRGTGKTFLARTVLSPIWGQVSVTNYNSDENELRKLLNSFLFNSEAVCLLDDVKTLNNNTLNRYITSPTIIDREFQTNNVFEKENKLQFFATGNGLKSTEDIERRSIPVDLFFPRDIRSRKFKYTISEESITSRPWRADMLQGLWSIVKTWERAGFPKPVPRGSLPSFDQYEALAVNATVYAGFCSPLSARKVDLNAGDQMGRAVLEILRAAADQIAVDNPDFEVGSEQAYTLQELINIGSAIYKLDIATNYANDPKKSLGISLAQHKGNIYTDNMGREFIIGSRRSSASTRYKFKILSPRTRELADNYILDP